MLRIGLVLLSALAVLAVCAVSSSSALAAPNWVINGKEFTGSESVEGVSGLADLEMTISGIKVTITCSVGKATGTIKETNKDSSSAIKFTGCKVAEPSGCKTTEEIVTVETKTELEEEKTTGKVWDKYIPNTGEIFTTIPIEGCAVEGSYKVTGSARCEIQSPKTEAIEKECVFNKESGSKLKFGNVEADFLATFKTKLTGTNKGKVWTAV